MAIGVAPPIGMFPVGSSNGCHLFSLRDCLGIGMEGAAVGGCSTVGGVLGGGMGGGDGGACPRRRKYKVARAPLSGSELWYRAA